MTCLYVFITDTAIAEALPADTEIEEIPATTDPQISHEAPATETTPTAVPVPATTPQPPLIEQTTEKTYEPPTQEIPIISEGVTEEDINSAAERTIGNTPQPPVIDTQPEPIYEPQIADKDFTEASDDKAVVSSEDDLEQQTIESISSVATDTDTNEPADKSIDETTITDSPSTENNIDDNKQQTTNWSDTAPQNVSADWLQLTSGEWLRGRIIIMQKDILEFDSDELDDLEIDWEKVKYIKSSEPYSLRFDGRISTVGAIEITQDKIHINTDYDDQTFDRSQLLSIATGKETEISKWTNKVTFSFNVRRGNTDQTDFTSKISAKRRTINSRLLLDYLGNFTEIEETKTINNHRINATFDIFITRNLFLTPLTVEFFRDPFQNIESRKNAGVAIGYTIINTNETEWDISGGPAYQETKFVSVQAGEPIKTDTATLILSTKFDTEVNSKVDLEGSYSVTLGDDTTGGYSHHALLTIETEITDKLDFDVTGVWDRIKSPVQAEDGNFPEPDDFRILIGLGYDL